MLSAIASLESSSGKSEFKSVPSHNAVSFSLIAESKACVDLNIIFSFLSYSGMLVPCSLIIKEKTETINIEQKGRNRK